MVGDGKGKPVFPLHDTRGIRLIYCTRGRPHGLLLHLIGAHVKWDRPVIPMHAVRGGVWRRPTAPSKWTEGFVCPGFCTSSLVGTSTLMNRC